MFVGTSDSNDPICAQDVAASARPHCAALLRMGHELRTPMNAIVGFTELLQRRAGFALDPVERRWLAMIQQAGQQAISVLDAYLAASQIECSQQERGPLMLRELIEACV